MEFLGIANLGILNVGSKPTFTHSAKEEFLDISLATGRVGTRIRFWKVSEGVSMSDHCHITLELGGSQAKK